MQLRLSPDQLDAKTALESAVEEVKQELVAESDDQKKDALKVELKEREAKLDTMLAEFEVIFADLPIYTQCATSLTSDTCPSASCLSYQSALISQATSTSAPKSPQTKLSALSQSEKPVPHPAETGCGEGSQRRDRHAALRAPAPGGRGAAGSRRRLRAQA